MFAAELSWALDMGIEHTNTKNERLQLAQMMVSRISSALMNLMGGDGYADPFVSSPDIPGIDRTSYDRNSPNGIFEGTGGVDMTDWIDSQLVCQGIAGNLIRLIDASVEDFALPSFTSTSSDTQRDTEKEKSHGATGGNDKASDRASDKVSDAAADTGQRERESPGIEEKRPPYSLLSRAVQIRLTSVLQQLCCRHTPQRRQLYILGAPYTLCTLFVHAVKTFRYESQNFARHLGVIALSATIPHASQIHIHPSSRIL